jgi:hypothetical protein
MIRMLMVGDCMGIRSERGVGGKRHLCLGNVASETHPALLILVTGHTSIIKCDKLGQAGKPGCRKRSGFDPKPQKGGLDAGE